MTDRSQGHRRGRALIGWGPWSPRLQSKDLAASGCQRHTSHKGSHRKVGAGPSRPNVLLPAFRSLSPPPPALRPGSPICSVSQESWGSHEPTPSPGPPHPDSVCPAVGQGPVLGMGGAWGARPWVGPGHSLFCPAAPVISSLCLSPLPAVPGSSSKAPVIWWQRVPGHWLTSSLFLVSPAGGHRIKGDQLSHGTQ